MRSQMILTRSARLWQQKKNQYINMRKDPLFVQFWAPLLIYMRAHMQKGSPRVILNPSLCSRFKIIFRFGLLFVFVWKGSITHMFGTFTNKPHTSMKKKPEEPKKQTLWATFLQKRKKLIGGLNQHTSFDSTFLMGNQWR